MPDEVVDTEESGVRADARRAGYFVRADGAVVIPPGDLAGRTYDLWMREVRQLRQVRVGNLRSDLLELLDALQGAASADGSVNWSAAKIVSVEAADSEPVVFLSVSHVADRLGCSTRHVTELLASGRLHGSKESRQWIVLQTDLDNYLNGKAA